MGRETRSAEVACRRRPCITSPETCKARHRPGHGISDREASCHGQRPCLLGGPGSRGSDKYRQATPKASASSFSATHPRLPFALHGVEELVFAMPGEVVSAARHWPAKELALEVL